VAAAFTMRVADWQTVLAEVDTFDAATIIARYNDVSTWQLSLPSSSPAARVFLTAARPRLLIYAGQTIYRSGPVIRLERQLDADGDLLTVNGVDDLVWLRRRLAHPQPGTAAPPYSTTAYDSRTGAASQVIAGYVDRNAGPSAVPARQVPNLTVATPAAFGGNVTTAARYQNLLEFVQQIATAAKVGIRVRDLAFEVFQPSGSAVFSVDLGTLGSWTSTVEAPDSTYVYVAGGGEGTARVIREYAGSALTAWGRIETFRDRRDTTTAADMDQSGAEELANGYHPPGVGMEALDGQAQQFLRDWNVGDLATVYVGTAKLQDVIVEAQIDLTANAPVKVSPVIGSPIIDLAQWRQVNAQDHRLRWLERI